MAGLTSKTIRPATSGYAQSMVPTSAAFAQIDEELSEYGLDSGNGAASPSTTLDTISGLISVSQDSLHPTVHPGFTTSNPVTVTGVNSVTGAPSVAASVLGSGGRLVCGATIVDGASTDVPKYTSDRSRIVQLSFLEACYSAPHYNYNNNYVDAGTPYVVVSLTMGIQRSTQTPGAVQLSFDVPITKPHNGATISQILVYCYLSVAPTSFGTTPPAEVILYQTDITTGAATAITNGTLPGTNVATYFVNGAVQTITITPTPPALVVDLTQYTYSLHVRDDHGSTWPAGTGCGVVWLGAAITYSSIPDESFPL